MADNKNKESANPAEEASVVSPAPVQTPAPAPAAIPEGKVLVNAADLEALQTQMADLEKRDADRDAKFAGLEQLLADTKGADTSGDGKLRERRNFEPKFRTVRLRKFPIAGDVGNKGIVIGWTDRGAYQLVDRSGVSPQVVDYIDIVFLDHERNEEGKLVAEKVKLLDLLNSDQVHCKIIDMKKEARKVPTNEEINVSMWDPQHGLVSTGETIDGWVEMTDIELTVQIPGRAEPVKVDEMYCN